MLLVLICFDLDFGICFVGLVVICRCLLVGV